MLDSLNSINRTVQRADRWLDLPTEETPQAAASFRDYIADVNARFQFYAHVVRLIGVLQQMADGYIDRLLISMPPRHGKSELVSRLFAAYFLRRWPACWVGITSYAADLAHALSRSARDNYERGGGVLRSDAYAVRHWETIHGGGLWAAGVGGPITGKGFDLGIIDDPIKNEMEAESATYRKRQKNWYQATFLTRAEPDAAIVVIQTRWHEDDLTGWLLAREAGDAPERWTVVHMPAIAEEAPPELPSTCTLVDDPRPPGAALCPERYDEQALADLAVNMGAYHASALLQCRPAPPGGALFVRAAFGIVHALPAGCRFCRYWDKAGTADAGDWSAGVLLAMAPDRRAYIVDAVRGQWSAGLRESMIRQTAELDRARFGYVSIRMEQEPGSSGKDVAQASVRNLAGFAVRASVASGDKVTRARPLAAQVEAGNVACLAGDWVEPFLAELAAFPYGAHDDQVDAAAAAYNALAAGSEMVATSIDWRQRDSAPPATIESTRSDAEIDAMLDSA